MLPAFIDPLWKSKSPTDFWRNRWNLATHETLKRGVFLPLKKAGYSTKFAIFAAFVASGLLHDYCWLVLFYKTKNDPCHTTTNNNDDAKNCFQPVFLKQLAFFCWCGVTMLLERPVGMLLPPIRWMAKNLPTIVVSTLVVLTAVPFAHWYTGDWIEGGYLSSYAQGVFTIRYVN
uniref:Wax synthase domain-containing protein n=1 Tax=Cyclophora tenuis TaxID=216820 RepID=A0A7S1GKY6_CYCTE|mmetsp:Transcript_18727/g.32023  ORF Transcript_18727/g.32023 Transcript_18727/m.32023 type:complete len:174 (+) Transcript_18727:200-721(+)